MSATTERLVRLGVITSVHGVRGQVKIRSFTADPRDLTAYGPLLGKDGKTVYGISVTGGTNEQLIASVEGITSRDDAERLRNVELFVPRTALPEPDENQYYHDDLIGLDVTCEDGSAYGRILAVNNFGAGNIILVKLTSGEEEYLPFNQDTFPVIDVKNKKIVVSPPEMITQDLDQL